MKNNRTNLMKIIEKKWKNIIKIWMINKKKIYKIKTNETKLIKPIAKRKIKIKLKYILKSKKLE